MKWIEASLPMRADTVHWPGHPQYTVTQMASFDAGDIMNVTAVAMCSHFGTHIDAPAHYVEGGTTVDRLSVDTLIGPCRVVDYDGIEHIPASFIDSLDLQGTTRLFIRTCNSRTLRNPEFREDFVALTPGAALRLVEKGVKLLGVDGYSIGPFDQELGVPVHRIFLGAGPGQVAIEAVDLSEVEPGDYEVVALPIPLADLEAAPTRVVFGKPEDRALAQ